LAWSEKVGGQIRFSAGQEERDVDVDKGKFRKREIKNYGKKENMRYYVINHELIKTISELSVGNRTEFLSQLVAIK
jgi:hypothetical protein